MGHHNDSPGSNSDTGRTFEEAAARLAELQLQLATHWRQVIHTAARQFATRGDVSSVPYLNVDGLMRDCELWIECAEQAYVEAVSKEEYCGLQAELANVALELLLQVRAWAEASERDNA